MEFSRERIVGAVRGLTPPRRVALCASCSERLIPFFEEYWAGRSGGPSFFRLALNTTWEYLEGAPFDDTQVAELRRQAEDNVPDEDDVAEQIYAQDAAIAVTHTLETWLTGAEESVARCFEQCYNVVDNYALNQMVPSGGVISEWTESQAPQHPAVQAELARQQRDLESCRRITEADWVATVTQLRTEAVAARIIPEARPEMEE